MRGYFSISSLGGIAALLHTHHQCAEVAILGVARSQMRPVYGTAPSSLG